MCGRRAGGLSMCISDTVGRWVNIVVDGSKAISWPVATLSICAVGVVLFRAEIRRLIDRVSEIKRDSGGWSIILAKAEERRSRVRQAASGAGQERALTSEPDIEDVRNAFNRINGLDMTKFNEYATQIRGVLAFYGLISRDDLAALAASEHIWSWLKALYVNELLRPVAAPLDPLAIAVWGAPMYKYGMDSGLLEQIEQRIRSSTEYAEKHKGA
jgi:hypothetical protein